MCQPHERDYTLAGRDVLADDRLAQLKEDICLFKELGINTVYVCKLHLPLPDEVTSADIGQISLNEKH